MLEKSIVLFTDFGSAGPYTGQVESVLHRLSPQTSVINLISNAPMANPRLGAYLLAALRFSFPENSIFLCIVDPGVGSQRQPLVLWADDQYFVGPDNGLLKTVAMQARQIRWWLIDWQPEHCSRSFHGRDIFAPIAAYLANGAADAYLQRLDAINLDDWSEDIAELIYFDVYGNAMTGLRYRPEMDGKILAIKNYTIRQADTFSAVREGEAFWYCNSSDLVEIAVNQGHAEQQLALQLGMTFQWLAYGQTSS